MSIKFDHTTIFTSRFSELVNFYSNLPGAKVNPPKSGYVEVKFDDSVFGLFDREYIGEHLGRDLLMSQHREGTVILQFLVNDVDSWSESWISAGISIIKHPENMPWGSRSAYFEDPDGNILELYKW